MKQQDETTSGAAAAKEEKKPLNKKQRRELKRAQAEEKAKAEAGKGKKDPAKPEKDKKASKTLTRTNAASVVAKITVEKDLKYIYPDNCQEGGTKDELLENRKKFRAGVRRKVAAFEAQMKKAMADPEKPNEKEVKRIEKEYKTYAKSVYVNPEALTVS